MKHEDWVRYKDEVETLRVNQFEPIPKTDSEKITELRAEVDGLAGRLKTELLAELRIEIERLINMEVDYARHSR